jgi:hypothetical protein
MQGRPITLGAVLGSALIALSAPASAQGPWAAPGPQMDRYGAMGPMAQPEAVAARLDALEAELKLQPNQKAAFDAYAAKLRAEAEARAQFRDGMRSRMGDPDAMLDYRVTIAKHRAEALDELNQRRKALVTLLTPEQKQVLDRHRPGPGPRMGGRGPGRGARCV